MRVSSEITGPTELAVRRLSQLPATVSHTAGIISSSVSITEVRIDEMIDSLIELHPHAQTDFGSYILDRMRSGFHQNWSNRIEVLRRGFAISPVSQTISQKFDQLVNLRNALAHGDGRLTALQTARPSAGIELRRSIERTFGIAVAGRELRLNHGAGAVAVTVACDYLLAMDIEYTRVVMSLKI